MTTVHTPSLGWIDIDVSIDALFADAHATAAEHADRLYRRFQAHALCEWQRAIPDGDYDDLPDDAPGSSDPETGESERIPCRTTGALTSTDPAVQERASSWQYTDTTGGVDGYIAYGPHVVYRTVDGVYLRRWSFTCDARAARVARTLNTLRGAR